MVAIALYGCGGGRTERDGPPPGDAVIPEYVPDAIPQVEAKSRYGNAKSYEVFGKRYYTLHSSVGYSQRGVASWYGKKFHGRRTSSGETYDMYAMTAAHKTLPLPTYARVTNLHNKRSIIVKINDRGPFHDNRLIDLSYSAAKRLGVLRKGTAVVQVEALDPLTWNKPVPPTTTLEAAVPAGPSTPEEPLTPTVSAAPADSAVLDSSTADEGQAEASLYLQVGACSVLSNAQKLSQKVGALADASTRISESADDVGQVFRVQVGPLGSVAEADRLTELLASAGFDNMYLVVE